MLPKYYYELHQKDYVMIDTFFADYKTYRIMLRRMKIIGTHFYDEINYTHIDVNGTHYRGAKYLLHNKR